MASIGLLVILLCQMASFALAQSSEVTWSKPIILSGLQNAVHPSIVADRYGGLHVFWSGSATARLYNPDTNTSQLQTQSAPSGDTIYYAHWNGFTWSKPLDLFFVDGLFYDYPVAVIDSADTIHLVWIAYDGIYYSSAPVAQAGNALAWQRSIRIGTGYGGRPAIVVDSTGGLHVAFAQWQDASTHQKNGNVYYTRSLDSGRSWMTPIPLSRVDPIDAVIVNSPRLAVDDDGTVYAVWAQHVGPDWLGEGVYLSRSQDRGTNWQAPAKLTRRQSDKDHNAIPEILILNSKEMWVVWACGEMPHRCEIRSSDGGRTWSAPQRLFGDLVSIAAYDGLTVDSRGRVYWVLQLRFPSAIYYSYWDGTRWADPPIPFITAEPLAGAHGPLAVITEGNKLNVVVYNNTAGEVWYLRGTTSAPYQAPAPAPTPAPSPTATPAVRPVTAMPTPSPQLKPTLPIVETEPIAGSGGGFSLLYGAVPVICLVMAVVLSRVFRSGPR